MESYLTLLSRLVVIAFVAFVISAAVTPTAKRIGVALSGTTVSESEDISTIPTEPVGRLPVVPTLIGVSVFVVCTTGLWYFQTRKLRQAIDQIKSLSGRVNFVPEFPSLTFSWLHSKTTLDLSGSMLNDTNLPNVSALPKLESLRIASTEITDQAARTISKCRYLKSLDISDTELGDQSITWISKLPRLETLIASQTTITDNCIELLLDTSKLRKFECADTAISAQGLKQLDNLRPEMDIVA